MPDQALFYRSLPKHRMPLEALLEDEQLFVPVPSTWYVVVVDVKNSTQAIQNGLHHAVNLTATGSIITVLNKLKSLDPAWKVPYFFGGDGATFLVPPQVLPEILPILEHYSYHVRKNMYLTLRVGALPVQQVYADQQTIRIAKFSVNRYLTMPIVLGLGIKHAERLIKEAFVEEAQQPTFPLQLDLDGMECRWEEIAPPNDNQKIVCLLMSCPDDRLQGSVYHAICQQINHIFGSFAERQPISTVKLNLDLSLGKMQQEMYARLGKFNLIYLVKNWLITAFGKFWFKYFKNGKAYLQQVSQLSYTLMIDGTFNCVVSGTTSQIDQLVDFLDGLEANGQVFYGIHVTHATVLCCYVEDRQSKHIHFVDGTEGGYTMAAKMFKTKAA